MPTQKTEVNTPSAAYRRMSGDWDMINALLGGTSAMRAARERYLPKHRRESAENYEERLCRTVLFNGFAKALNSLAAEPFRRPAKVAETPKGLEAMVADVDRRGNSLSSFAQLLFKDGLAKGLTHLLVDYPRAEGEANLSQERAADRRPYFCHVRAESLIAAYAEEVGGVEKLVHVRILEQETRRDGEFGEYTVNRVRVLEPGTWKVYEQARSGRKWFVAESGTTSLDFVPLLTYYYERVGLMESVVPLLDLAHKNVEHWQSSSDQRNALTVARFPILAASGLKDPNKVNIAPRKVLSMDDPQGKFYYLEHNGEALAAGKGDLESIKAEMATLGTAMLVEKPGTQTATEASIDKAEQMSDLGRAATDFADFLASGFVVAGKWVGTEVDKKKLGLSLHTDFGVPAGDQADLDALDKARKAREISHEAYVEALKRRNVLPPDFDAAADQEKLDAEPPPLALLPPPGAAKPPKPGDPPAPPGKKPAPPSPPKAK